MIKKREIHEDFAEVKPQVEKAIADYVAKNGDSIEIYADREERLGDENIEKILENPESAYEIIDSMYFDHGYFGDEEYKYVIENELDLPQDIIDEYSSEIYDLLQEQVFVTPDYDHFLNVDINVDVYTKIEAQNEVATFDDDGKLVAVNEPVKFFLDSQGYTEQEFFDYYNAQEDFEQGSGKQNLDTNSFLGSLAQEIDNTYSGYWVEPVFLGNVNLQDLAKGYSSLTIPADANCGLVTTMEGAGGVLGVVLEKPITLSKDQSIVYFYHGYHYNVDEIYGLSSSAWKADIKLEGGKAESFSEKAKKLKATKAISEAKHCVDREKLKALKTKKVEEGCKNETDMADLGQAPLTVMGVNKVKKCDCKGKKCQDLGEEKDDIESPDNIWLLKEFTGDMDSEDGTSIEVYTKVGLIDTINNAGEPVVDFEPLTYEASNQEVEGNLWVLGTDAEVIDIKAPTPEYNKFQQFGSGEEYDWDKLPSIKGHIIEGEEREPKVGDVVRVSHIWTKIKSIYDDNLVHVVPIYKDDIGKKEKGNWPEEGALVHKSDLDYPDDIRKRLAMESKDLDEENSSEVTAFAQEVINTLMAEEAVSSYKQLVRPYESEVEFKKYFDSYIKELLGEERLDVPQDLVTPVYEEVYELLNDASEWNAEESLIKNTLSEEKGPYAGDISAEYIATKLELGHQGGYEPYRFGHWEVKAYINGRGDLFAADSDLTDAMQDYLAQEISYPVRDGHMSYRGLDILIDLSCGLDKVDILSLGNEDFTEEEIDQMFAGKKQLECWIDYDIEYDEKIEESLIKNTFTAGGIMEDYEGSFEVIKKEDGKFYVKSGELNMNEAFDNAQAAFDTATDKIEALYENQIAWDYNPEQMRKSLNE